jgi:Trypsin
VRGNRKCAKTLVLLKKVIAEICSVEREHEESERPCEVWRADRILGLREEGLRPRLPTRDDDLRFRSAQQVGGEQRSTAESVQSVPCSGDSGGPMVARTATGPVLVGILEAGASPTKSDRFYGVLCGLRGYNSIHTRAAAYLSFIQTNL